MRDWKWSEGEAFKKICLRQAYGGGRQGAAVYKPPSGDIGGLASAVPWPEGNRVAGTREEIGQAPRFILSCWMFKPLYFLILGLLAAGPLLAQTEPNKSPASKDPDKPPTIKEPAKKPAEQSPPPAPGQSPATAPNVSTDASAKPQVDKNPPPLDPANMDTSVKPAEDFYLFANGGWIKKNPVPPEFSRWASFNELAEKNNDALKEITEKAAGGNAPADASGSTKKSK